MFNESIIIRVVTERGGGRGMKERGREREGGEREGEGVEREREETGQPYFKEETFTQYVYIHDILAL